MSTNKLKTILIQIFPFSVLSRLKKLIEQIRLFVNPPSINPSYPSFAMIEITNKCHLKCPLCPTGSQILKIKKGSMDLDSFKKILHKLNFVDIVTLSNWGESLLNPDINDIIGYAKSKGKIVSIHSTLSVKKDDDFFYDFVNSGLDKLTISVDGASQEGYSKYRVGGDFDLVIENIKKLVDAKIKLKKKNPTIIWKFLVHKYNEHEIRKGKRLAKELEIEFLIEPIKLSDSLPDCNSFNNIEKLKEDWLPNNKKYISKLYKRKKRFPIYDKTCNLLFDSIVIHPDGKVTPCFYITNEINSFGNIFKEDFRDIWYNDKYKSSRSLFTKKKFEGTFVETICLECKIFKKIK